MLTASCLQIFAATQQLHMAHHGDAYGTCEVARTTAESQGRSATTLHAGLPGL